MSPAVNNDLPLFLAPMAGVTNTVFRQICKAHGADILTSEFVSAEGILHRNSRTRYYVEFHPAERPIGIQLFGADPGRLAEAVRALIDWVHPDFIDLNFGCPVNKVVARNGGSALLKDCPLLARVASAVVRAAGSTPVTAKIRIGWDSQNINAETTARILEGEGIRRLAVHGRTKAQGYSGEADWETIGRVAGSLRIPVIGNGDIRSGADALRRIRRFPVSGLMIGRAAMSNPWIFSEVRCALRGLPYEPPSDAQRWKLILEHSQKEIAWRGNELAAMKAMRSRLMASTRGMKGGAQLRSRLSRVTSHRELAAIAGDTTPLPRPQQMACD